MGRGTCFEEQGMSERTFTSSGHPGRMAINKSLHLSLPGMGPGNPTLNVIIGLDPIIPIHKEIPVSASAAVDGHGNDIVACRGMTLDSVA